MRPGSELASVTQGSDLKRSGRTDNSIDGNKPALHLGTPDLRGVPARSGYAPPDFGVIVPAGEARPVSAGQSRSLRRVTWTHFAHRSMAHRERERFDS
jgi:hypothetical protein